MRIEWIADDDDIARVKAFYEKHRNTPFVKPRLDRHLRADKPPVFKTEVWACLAGCFITAQHRPGAVTREPNHRNQIEDYRISTGMPRRVPRFAANSRNSSRWLATNARSAILVVP
jgi:hypothetical protein